MAVSVSQLELQGLMDVKRQLENTLGVKIELYPIDSHLLVSTLERMVATNSIPWDLIIVDNDTLGILVQKGLVQELSQYQLDKALPRDTLFQALQKKLRIDGRDYFVPFRANVKLLYYNQDYAERAGYNQPPTTLGRAGAARPRPRLSRPVSSGRVAIQAHPGKAAAVTVFEWVTSMGGNPLTLDDDEEHGRPLLYLWNLAPYLAPESTTTQFDTANNILITDEVAVVDNWTYGIKVVMGDFEKTHIKVTSGWLEEERACPGRRCARNPERGSSPRARRSS